MIVLKLNRANSKDDFEDTYINIKEVAAFNKNYVWLNSGVCFGLYTGEYNKLTKQFTQHY